MTIVAAGLSRHTAPLELRDPTGVAKEAFRQFVGTGATHIPGISGDSRP